MIIPKLVDFVKIIGKANRDVKILEFVSHLNNNVVVGEIEGKLSVNMNNECVKLINVIKKKHLKRNHLTLYLTS